MGCLSRKYGSLDPHGKVPHKSQGSILDHVVSVLVLLLELIISSTEWEF